MTFEVLPGQQRAQLVDVATLQVNPSPEADGRRFDSWTGSVAEQRNECDVAGTRLVEVRRFGSPGVDRRDGQTVGDVPERMCVTDRQVVQPALHARVAADREIRLIPGDVE